MRMKKVKVSEEYIVATNFEYDDIKELSEESSDVMVVCFENNFSTENYYIKLLNESWIKGVILIGAKPTSCFGKKLIVVDELKEKFFKGIKKVFFVIDTDVDEDVLVPLVQLFDISKKNGIEIGLKNVLGFSNELNTDLLKTLEALTQEDIYIKYEIIYDYICDELDKRFSNNSICKFENDRCIVNRKYYNKDKIMGCCYSFKYNGLQFSDIKLCEHQKDSRCNVKCMGCKLFTCEYLKKHGIRFSLNNIPVALAFFSKKQREILRTTFFTSKEIVLRKVIGKKR